MTSLNNYCLYSSYKFGKLTLSGDIVCGVPQINKIHFRYDKHLFHTIFFWNQHLSVRRTSNNNDMFRSTFSQQMNLWLIVHEIILYWFHSHSSNIQMVRALFSYIYKWHSAGFLDYTFCWNYCKTSIGCQRAESDNGT